MIGADLKNANIRNDCRDDFVWHGICQWFDDANSIKENDYEVEEV